MNYFRLTKGLTLPIEGAPQQATAETGLQADVAGAVAAKGVVLLEVRSDDNGILLRAHVHRVGKREVIAEDVRTSQSALLRVVREQVERAVNSR